MLKSLYTVPPIRLQPIYSIMKPCVAQYDNTIKIIVIKAKNAQKISDSGRFPLSPIVLRSNSFRVWYYYRQIAEDTRIKTKTHLVISDVHHSKHCLKYARLIELVIKKIKPNTVIQVGDFTDFSTLSKYVRDPRDKTTARDEIESYREQMLRWANLMPEGSTFHQICGNHDIRMIKTLWSKAPEMAELMGALSDMLGFRELNKIHKVKFVWHDYHDWNSCRIGDTVITHGFYYGKNLAVSNLDKYPGVNVVQGHSHRALLAYHGDRWAASIGHGSDENKTRHLPCPSGWTQCFAVLTEIDSKCSIELIPVNNGSCILRGVRL